ncbi:hypothetical protein ARMSODRAFT_1053626 [Armillaria solidipes]|uniref:Uncharacterized protein n=1 Tax=Armillaria solidipes TaxID=1076256 RepID=A0A2H3BCY1_9AGAR|nr:hypothetical protein ARMSODRAFT_1053626 [Armillaria solidipes]
MFALTTIEEYITTAHARLINYSSLDNTDKTTLILGALLLHAPSKVGQRNVATDILSSVNDAAIKALADLYLCGLLAPMRACRENTPMIGENVEEISLIDTAEREQSTLKELAHARDDSRCVITNSLDDEVKLSRKNKGEVISMQDQRTSSYTTTAHILPFSLTPNSEKAADIRKSSKTFELIERFSGFKIIDRVTGIDINRIDNVMTITLGAHKALGALHIWLEAVRGRANTYVLRNPGEVEAGTLINGKEITLVASDPRFALPNPKFLAIHAACAKIYHASGMGEVIDQVLRDKEVVKVLSEDGTGPSFKVLEYSLVLLAF